jgi:integrase
MKLTKANISGLALPAGKHDVIIFDEDLPGFGLRVRTRASGWRWVAQYMVDGHQQRRVTIGRFELFSPEEARRIARDLLAKARLGQDPQREREVARAQARVTLGTVAETYLKAKRAELRRKSFDELTRYLRKHWQLLHGMPLHQITRRDVAARVSELVQESGPAAARRASVSLSGLFAFAIAAGLVEANPVIGSTRPAPSRPRDRVLKGPELAEVWRACGDDDYGRIIRLLILTGARRQEVGGMAWSELDAEQGTWTIPKERAKNGRPLVLPLPPLAWQIIQAVPHRAGIDHLFGRGRQGFIGFDKPKTALDSRLPLPRWVLHDLRRSTATGMAEIGILPHIVEVVLNHASGFRAGVAGTYNRALYQTEMQIALAMWADHVRALVEGGERKIAQLPARADLAVIGSYMQWHRANGDG